MSLDGRYIVWESNRGDGNTIWRMDVDGGNPKQLTKAAPDYFPTVSPDGKSVVFIHGPGDEAGNILRKVGIDGGIAAPIRALKT